MVLRLVIAGPEKLALAEWSKFLTIVIAGVKFQNGTEVIKATSIHATRLPRR
jgi:hypothetical protein